MRECNLRQPEDKVKEVYLKLHATLFRRLVVHVEEDTLPCEVTGGIGTWVHRL